MDYLIQNNLIKLNKQGNYGDQLVVTGGRHHRRNQHNSQHKGRKKQRYTIDDIYNKLINSQLNKKVDLNEIKDNQKYLFSKSNNNKDKCVS